MNQSSILAIARNAFEKFAHLQNNLDPNNQTKIVTPLRRSMAMRSIASNTLNKRLIADFMDKYKATVSKGAVGFTIPKGTSVADLLRDAQTVSYILRGVVAVYPPRLAAWMKNKTFTKKLSSHCKCFVLPLVSGSEWKTRNEQVRFLKEKKLQIAQAWELAAAHAIYSVFTNKKQADVFSGNIIRVKGTKLYYGDGGLSEMDESDYVNNCRYERVKIAGVKFK